MPLQNFIARALPTIKAAWLNQVDVLKFTVFDDATTKSAAVTALGLQPYMLWVGTDSGSAGAAVVTVGGSLTSFTRTTGVSISFTPAAANTSTATLNVNGTGAAAVLNHIGNALTGGELSVPVIVQWTGSAWKIVSGAVTPNLARTPREVAKSVVPVNYLVEPYNILRYGTNTTPGTTDMAAAFTAAITLRVPIFVPNGLYRHNGQMTSIVEGGLIGEQLNTSQADGNTRIIFYNITGATEAAVRLSYDATNVNGPRFFENLDIFASSWDAVTGCSGYGIEITGTSRIRNVQIAGFKASNMFLHNTTVDGQAPYGSLIENVLSLFSGKHGIVVGTGTNTVTFINCDGKNNGAPSYLTAPSVAGNFDGFFVDHLNEGNPGSAFFSRVPEGVKVIGGDCSANSRYGWNFRACQSGTFMPSYAEANLQAAPGQANLDDCTNCFFVLDGIDGRRAGVNFSLIGSGSDLGGNRVFIGGRDCGAGDSNTEASQTQMANARKICYFGHNNDFSNASLIFSDTAGVTNFSVVGTGKWNLNSTPLYYAGTQVLSARVTGWGTATGTATKTTFDTATVTLPQLAERVKALIDALHGTAGHGLIGT